jgi:hypothetical protein
MRKNTLLCAFALLLTLFSCKKENEPSPQQRILGVWRTSSIQFTSGSTTEEEPLEECARNSTFDFRAGGVLVSTDACNDRVRNDTYSFSSDNKVLSFTIEGFTSVFNVEELSNTTLRLTRLFEEEDITQTITFTRQ